MHRFQYFGVVAIALIACAHGYPSSAPGGYAPLSSSSASDAAAATAGNYQIGPNAGSASNDGATAIVNTGTGESLSPGNYGTSQNLPYSSGNTKGNTVTSSITYPQNKGEILIHRPAPIIVKRPPTKVLVNHPPLVVKPAPVVLHKPPAIVLRKVYVKHHPRPVKVEPVYVNVVKPPAEKYFVNEKQQQYATNQYQTGPAAYGPAPAQTLPAYTSGADSAAVNAGYQLLQGNQGLAALANIAGTDGYNRSGPSSYAASGPTGY